MKIFKYLRNKRLEHTIKKNQERVHLYGEDVLNQFSRTVNSLGYEFSPFFGTLLGIYREHDFIKYDDDVDIAMDVKYLTPQLLIGLSNAGFLLDHLSMASDFRGSILSMKYKNIVTEIYFSYKSENNGKQVIYAPYPANHDWEYYYKSNMYPVKEYETPTLGSMVDYDFRGGVIQIPNNTSTILEALYGKDYMTPIKNRKARVQDAGFPWIEKRWHAVPMHMIDEDILRVIRGE